MKRNVERMYLDIDRADCGRRARTRSLYLRNCDRVIEVVHLNIHIPTGAKCRNLLSIVVGAKEVGVG